MLHLSLFFSEKSRDPHVLRSVQKYHVFQRFYGSSLESITPRIIVTQNIKPKKNFSEPKSKKANVSSINSIRMFYSFLSLLKLISIQSLVVSFIYIYKRIYIYPIFLLAKIL